MTATARVTTGQMAYHAGSAAEGIVAADYGRRGFAVLETRWRGDGGEVDLVVTDGATLVFVEVKKSKSFANAAARISPRQMQRIYAAAAQYLGLQPKGSLSEARFDVALVDGIGAVQIIENAFEAS